MQSPPSATNMNHKMQCPRFLFLSQISPKLEWNRKGNRWIFNLTSTPTQGSHSLFKSQLKSWGKERRRMNPSSPRAKGNRAAHCLFSESASATQPERWPTLLYASLSHSRSPTVGSPNGSLHGGGGSGALSSLFARVLTLSGQNELRRPLV